MDTASLHQNITNWNFSSIRAQLEIAKNIDEASSPDPDNNNMFLKLTKYLVQTSIFTKIQCSKFSKKALEIDKINYFSHPIKLAVANNEAHTYKYTTIYTRNSKWKF